MARDGSAVGDGLLGVGTAPWTLAIFVERIGFCQLTVIFYHRSFPWGFLAWTSKSASSTTNSIITVWSSQGPCVHMICVLRKWRFWAVFDKSLDSFLESLWHFLESVAVDHFNIQYDVISECVSLFDAKRQTYLSFYVENAWKPIHP